MFRKRGIIFYDVFDKARTRLNQIMKTGLSFDQKGHIEISC